MTRLAVSYLQSQLTGVATGSACSAAEHLHTVDECTNERPRKTGYGAPETLRELSGHWSCNRTETLRSDQERRHWRFVSYRQRVRVRHLLGHQSATPSEQFPGIIDRRKSIATKDLRCMNGVFRGGISRKSLGACRPIRLDRDVTLSASPAPTRTPTQREQGNG